MAATSFLECVATVAAEAREQARTEGGEAELIDIAYWSRASQGAISRFENHLSQPRDLDRLLLAYEKVCGVPAAQLLRKAVDRWEAARGTEHPLDQVALELEAAAEEHGQPPARTARAAPARRRAGPTR